MRVRESERESERERTAQHIRPPAIFCPIAVSLFCYSKIAVDVLCILCVCVCVCVCGVVEVFIMRTRHIEQVLLQQIAGDVYYEYEGKPAHVCYAITCCLLY